MTNNKMKIPLAKPEIHDADIAAVRAVLQEPEGRLAMGPRLEAFEQDLATAVDRTFAMAVNSGTSALHLVIRALGISSGDEVITTPFSFIASANCVLFERATPVFVDIEPRTLCIDPERIDAAITPRTKAILAVDVFGHPADWPALERIADRHGLALIDDSAEALGSELKGRRCGSFGRAGVFGFYPNKQITTGEGGAVVTDDPRLAELCRSMADQGRGGEGWLHHVRLGYNYRLDELSAALGLSQLRRLDEIVEGRGRVAERYSDALAGLDGIVLPSVTEGVRMSWFVYVVRLAAEFSQTDRDTILERLSDRGIGCRNYFAPIHLQPFYRELLGTAEGDFPVTEAVGARSIALPFYNELSEDQIDYVAVALREEVERLG